MGEEEDTLLESLTIQLEELRSRLDLQREEGQCLVAKLNQHLLSLESKSTSNDQEEVRWRARIT